MLSWFMRYIAILTVLEPMSMIACIKALTPIR